MNARVLFIGGLGRSGSTLLELLLGDVPRVVAIGEVKHLWERGLRDNDLCGCGAPFRDCPFWRGVGEEAFGGWSRVDPDVAVATARAADRHRQLAAALRAGKRRGSGIARYGDMLARLFAAVRAVSGAEVIVDSSKDPPHGFVLRSVTSLDVRAVHLVRDSRGVAFSWSKVVARPDSAKGALMSRMSAPRAGLMWIDANLLVEGLGVLGVPSVRVRYEDLVADPVAELGRVSAVAGVEMPSTAALHGSAPRQLHHGVGGNPIRFQHSAVTVQADDEWQRQMRTADRRAVTGLTAPLLVRYGYPVRPGQGRDDGERRQLGTSLSQRSSRSSKG